MFANFYLYVGSNSFAVSGYESAWEAYRTALPLGELLGLEVALVDASNGEVFQSSSDDEGEDFDEEYLPDDLEMGFDPYSGCYTFDC